MINPVKSGWFWMLFYFLFAVAFGSCTMSKPRPDPEKMPAFGTK